MFGQCLIIVIRPMMKYEKKEMENSSPKSKLAFGYLSLHDFHANKRRKREALDVRSKGC